MRHLNVLALAAAVAVASLSTASTADAAGINSAAGAKQISPLNSPSAARQQAYCKNGVSYTFTYNSDGTIATMSWTYDECVAAGGK